MQQRLDGVCGHKLLLDVVIAHPLQAGRGVGWGPVHKRPFVAHHDHVPHHLRLRPGHRLSTMETRQRLGRVNPPGFLFNGATAFRRWKPRNTGQSRLPRPAFNGATAFQRWKQSPAATGATRQLMLRQCLRVQRELVARFRFCNDPGSHQAVGYWTPAELFRKRTHTRLVISMHLLRPSSRYKAMRSHNAGMCEQPELVRDASPVMRWPPLECADEHRQ